MTFIRHHQGNITWKALDSKIYSKKYHTTYSIEDSEKLISAEVDLKRTIFQRKRKYFNKWISELSHTTNMKKFWNIINQLREGE